MLRESGHVLQVCERFVFPLDQDEVLFDSWDAIFNEGRMKDGVSIYSFDGKDVLSDDAW